MKKVIFGSFLIALLSCNSNYDPRQESEHVNNLNRDRLNSMLADMMNHIEHYNFTDDPDLDFAGLMKLHHSTAIQMAKREIEWGKNPDVIKFAKEMVASELKEVDYFEQYEHIHKVGNKDHSFFDEAEKSLFNEQRPAEKGNIDRVFSSLMIIHHKSAITVSQIYLRHGTDSSLKNVAQDIINHHQHNIRELEDVISKMRTYSANKKPSSR